jgi:hypothetical protein
MKSEREIASIQRGFRERRKACHSRFCSHPLQSQPLSASERTCLEGPFGEVLCATGPMAKAIPFRFSTKYQDGETGLLHYGHRYYSASFGRVSAKVKGTLSATRRSGSTVAWRLAGGTVNPQKDRFSFENVGAGRGIVADIVSLEGLAMYYLGFLREFDVDFTRPVSINSKGTLTCDK